MTVLAIVVFVVAYLLIATERIPKTVAALGDVSYLLLGMRIIVGILRRTGVFEFTAIRRPNAPRAHRCA